MKTSKALKKYFQKRSQAIDALLKKPSAKYTRSDFHSLRVEIKKINALLKLICFSQKYFDKSIIYKPYKSIFKQAGKIRELQLEEASLEKNLGQKKLEKYRAHLKQSKLKKRKKFFKKITIELKQNLKKSEEIILFSINRTTKKNVSDYIENEKNKAEALMEKKELDSKEVHQLRKLLKTLFYIKKILHDEKTTKPLTQLQEFQELLGKWHDKAVINRHLKKAIKHDNVKASELALLKKTQINISGEKEKLFKSINKKMHKESI